MGQLWIEGTDDGGSDWAARWANVSDERADQITDFIERLVGKPDTIS